MVESRFRWKLDPETSEFLTEIATSNRAIMGFGRTSSQQLTRINRGFAAARNAAIGFVGALSLREFLRSSTSAITELTRIRSALMVATGSTEAANAEFAFLREEADRLGLSLRITAQEYAGLAAAARGTALEGETTRQIFLGVVEASTALGLSADQTGGALTAIEQIISKGRVSAEELRQQLGERLPGAFQIAARSIGVTTAELDELLEAGELTAEELLPQLAQELRNTFGEQAQANATNLIATMNRLETASFDFLNAVGRGGLADGIADFAQSLSEAADGADSAAETIGTTLGTALSVAGDAVLFLGRNLDVLTSLAAAFIATKIVSFALSLVTALRAASVAAGGLTAALAANPISVFAVAVGAAVGALTLLAQRMDESDERADQLRQRLAEIREEMRDVEDATDDAGQALVELAEGYTRLDALRVLRRVESDLRDIERILDRIVQNQLGGAATTLTGRTSAEFATEAVEAARRVLELREEFNNAVISASELEAEIAQIASELTTLNGGLAVSTEALGAYADEYERFIGLLLERSQLQGVIDDPDSGLPAPTDDDDGGGGRPTRSGSSRRDRFADTQADLEAAIEAERRLQEAARESNEAIEDARDQTRLLADIRRIEAQFTGEQREELIALTEELFRQAEQTERVMEATETHREAQELVNEILNEGADAAALYAAAMQALNDLQVQGKITAEQRAAAEDALNDRFREGSDTGEEVGRAVSTAFREIVTDIENAEQAAIRFLNRLAEITLQAAIFGPLENALTGAFSGGGGLFGGGGGIGGGTQGGSTSFGGGKAGGGPIRPGLAYRVGERGPETIVPTMPSLVMPNEIQPVQSAPAVNVTINTQIDATGADPAELRRVERQVEHMERTMPHEIAKTVAKGVRSGGPMAKVVGARR